MEWYHFERVVLVVISVMVVCATIVFIYWDYIG